jgi:hypothetical protein
MEIAVLSLGLDIEENSEDRAEGGDEAHCPLLPQLK